MFLVKSGILESMSEGGEKILKSFSEGHSFGAISLIKLGNGQSNRRDCILRSVGYSEIYILKQESVLDILYDYPEEKRRLILKGFKQIIILILLLIL